MCPTCSTRCVVTGYPGCRARAGGGGWRRCPRRWLGRSTPWSRRAPRARCSLRGPARGEAVAVGGVPGGAPAGSGCWGTAPGAGAPTRFATHRGHPGVGLPGEPGRCAGHGRAYRPAHDGALRPGPGAAGPCPLLRFHGVARRVLTGRGVVLSARSCQRMWTRTRTNAATRCRALRDGSDGKFEGLAVPGLR